MSLRGRFLLVSLLVAVLPLASLAFGLRREAARQLRDLYGEQVTRLEFESRQGLAERGQRIDRALAAVRDRLLDDNQLRDAVREKRSQDSQYLFDLGKRLMDITGLDAFEIQNEQGLIVTSGHFREQYDRPGLPWPRATDRSLFAEVTYPDGWQWVRVRTLSFEVAGEAFRMMGGLSADWMSLPGKGVLGSVPRAAAVTVQVLDSGGKSLRPGRNLNPEARTEAGTVAPANPPDPSVLSADAEWFHRDVPVDLYRGRPPQVEVGRVKISAPMTHLEERLARLDRWFLGAALATVLFALALALLAAGALSRPLRLLAEKTTHVRIGRRYVDFRTDREDELGDLSRFIGLMVDRLQGSAEQLREAERTATVGEIARQVHHDIRNGLTPIRNVMRHLSEVSEQTPEELAATFAERSGTIDAGLQYLDELSTNYARLTPRQQRTEVDLNTVVHAVSDPLFHGGLDIRLDLAHAPVRILADPVGLRRIVENLVRNASESLPTEGGWIDLCTEQLVAEPPQTLSESSGSTVSSGSTSSSNFVARPGVLLSVRDNGVGMDEQTQRRVFDHFYSTKPTGVGLGLGIVKRLVADFSGRIELESVPEEGTTFRIWFPAAAPFASLDQIEPGQRG